MAPGGIQKSGLKKAAFFTCFHKFPCQRCLTLAFQTANVPGLEKQKWYQRSSQSPRSFAFIHRSFSITEDIQIFIFKKKKNMALFLMLTSEKLLTVSGAWNLLDQCKRASGFSGRWGSEEAEPWKPTKTTKH